MTNQNFVFFKVCVCFLAENAFKRSNIMLMFRFILLAWESTRKCLHTHFSLLSSAAAPLFTLWPSARYKCLSLSCHMFPNQFCWCFSNHGQAGGIVEGGHDIVVTSQPYEAL